MADDSQPARSMQGDGWKGAARGAALRDELRRPGPVLHGGHARAWLRRGKLRVHPGGKCRQAGGVQDEGIERDEPAGHHPWMDGRACACGGLPARACVTVARGLPDESVSAPGPAGGRKD